MPYRSPRTAAPLAAAFSLLTVTMAQAPVTRFVARQPIVRMAIHDIPALLEALPQTRIGGLFAQPDVAAAIEHGRACYVDRQTRWARAFDRLRELDPSRGAVDKLVQREVIELDWHYIDSAAMIATQVGAHGFGMQTTMSIEPITAVEGRLAQRFEHLTAQLRGLAGDATRDTKLQLGADKIDGFPALVLTAPEPDREQWQFSEPNGSWLLHLPGQFVGGDGTPEVAGHCEPTQPPAPGLSLQIDLVSYLRIMSRGFGEPIPDEMLRAIGIDVVRRFDWSLRPAGELLQSEVALQLDGRPGGILGALIDGMAPLVDQPLPEQALLQVRLAFDVRALIAAVDELLSQSQMPTLGELQIAEDLNQAWTGGIALAVARPAVGGMVPRLYASFGIVDQAAFGRLLARLGELPGLQPKEVTYEGRPCMQLRLDGAPPAVQPSYCVQDGVVHFAESGLALRALLKAQADDASPALEVGEAPRPDGPGAALPSFDLRFDGAAIHAALCELWLPLTETFASSGSDAKPLVPMDEMPDVEVVTEHLRPGRGVLRRSPERIVLSMSGTAGGPELHAMLAAYGPFLSAPMTSSWKQQTDTLQVELAHLQLPRVHAAIDAFRERTGRMPSSFGELLAGGDLADAALLRLEGDEQTEPVLHEGKEVARTSFRYFPNGEKMSPQGEEITVRLAMLHEVGWQKVLVAEDGSLHESWDGFGGMFVDEIVETETVIVDTTPPPEPVRTETPK